MDYTKIIASIMGCGTRTKVETTAGVFPLTAHLSTGETSGIIFTPVYRENKIAYFQTISIKAYNDEVRKTWEYTDENIFKVALALYDKANSVRERSEKETIALGNAMAKRITAYKLEANKWASKGEQRKTLEGWYAQASEGLEGKRLFFVQQMAVGIA